MRALTQTLLAAQKAASGAPYVRAVFSDYAGDRSRVRLKRHYTGPEGEYFCAVVGAGDGSLIRARIDPATKVLFTSRVASPGPESTFSSWMSHGTVSGSAAVALAWRPVQDEVVLFYVAADGVTLTYKVSSDNGATWSGANVLEVAAAAVGFVALGYNPSGSGAWFWTVGATVRVFAGAGPSAAWTNSVASITGIACSYLLDFDVVVCGTASATGDAKVWTAIFGDGVEQAQNTWSALSEVATASAGSNVSFRSPALALLQHWRLFFVEKYAGTQAYSRLQSSVMNAATTFSNEQWSEPAAFEFEGDYGVAASAANLDGYLWLASAAGVWSGRSPTQDDLDVSEDVIEAAVEIAEGSGLARLVLRNDPAANGLAGRFAGYGSGALSALRRGARLQLAAGYRTSLGPETPVSPAYWVESIEQTTGAEARLIVQARDAWSLLDRWRAKHQFFWQADALAVSQLLQFVCSRAGLSIVFDSASDAITELKPAFTIHPGESGRTALQRLLAVVPDQAFADGGGLRVRFPQEGDATDYVYVTPGPSQMGEHALVSARYRDLGPATNRVRVLGAGIFNEGFDFSDIESMGEHNLLVNDINLTTAGQAADRAGFGLREAGLRSARDEIRLAGVNCGQELYDVVSITDPQAGLEGAKRRVLGLSWRYKSAAAGGEPAYATTLLLGKP
jgi:hypothetical protein